jgi:hypothetical protein
VRGVVEPIEVLALEAEGTVQSRLEASLRRGISPSRGRTQELGLLAGCWEHVLRGQGRLCVLSESLASASRVSPMKQQSLGLAERVEAEATAHARGAAFFVFRQLLRSLALVDPGADSRPRRERRPWPRIARP